MKWRLDKDAAALLHSMTGSDDAEDATEVTLFVGESRDDDGKLVYGLHGYESEYPEEGVIPLVEFPAPCKCGKPWVLNTVHRANTPCYLAADPADGLGVPRLDGGNDGR